MGKNGLQREMDNVFQETRYEEFSIRKITKGGFSQSRKNLSPEAFLELNDGIVKDFYKELEYLGYHGHRLLAVEGSFLNLPSHETIKDEFGTRGMGRGNRNSSSHFDSKSVKRVSPQRPVNPLMPGSIFLPFRLRN